MSTSYPTSLDNLPNPGPDTYLDDANPALDHDVQHTNANDAIEALQAKVGIDNSANADSLDYKIAHGGALRQTAQITTDEIAPDATDDTQLIALGKGCLALKVATSVSAWVRIYSTLAAQTADATREQTTDPTDEHGVLLEVITTADNLSLDLSPAAACYSLESSPGATLPVTVTNLDDQAAQITVEVTYLPMEG